MIEDAVIAVRSGRIVGVPTDTVYGLAVDPTLESAARALYEVKGRVFDKPIAVLGESLAQLLEIVEIPPEIETFAVRHWPGPLTLVLHAHVPLASGVGDHERGTVAVRVPDHPIALELLAQTGPLAVTSANRTGEPPALDDVMAREEFGATVAVYLPGVCPGREASTVIDMTVDPPALLRKGPVEFGNPELSDDR